MTHKRYAQIYDECWNLNVLIVWGVDREGLRDFLSRKFGIDNFDEHDGAGVFVMLKNKDGDEIAVIGMSSPFDQSPYQYSILAHECFHAAHNVLKSRGVTFSRKSEESFAYLLGSLVDRLATKMIQKEKKILASLSY